MDLESGNSHSSRTNSIGSDKDTDDNVQCGYNVAAVSSRASQDTCRWNGVIIVIIDGADLTGDIGMCETLGRRRCQDRARLLGIRKMLYLFKRKTF